MAKFVLPSLFLLKFLWKCNHQWPNMQAPAKSCPFSWGEDLILLFEWKFVELLPLANEHLSFSTWFFLKDVRRLQSVQEYQWFNCYNVCARWSLQQFVLYVNTQKKVCNIDHFFLVEFRQLLLIVSKSSPQMVVKGVPQGSIFVPWLFNLHLKMYFQIIVVMFIFYDTTLTTGYKTTKGFCRLEAAIENIQTAFMNIKLVMMSQKTNKQKC